MAHLRRGAGSARHSVASYVALDDQGAGTINLASSGTSSARQAVTSVNQSDETIVASFENQNAAIANSEEKPTLPLSLLNDFLYCPRRAALKIIEGWRESNEHTARGDIVHAHADLPGYEVAKGVTLWRALPVWSERLGLSGKCDVVEQPSNGALCPVEYKKGKRRRFENDDAQLCAQAFCLEEMFKTTIAHGAIFHAESKRRREAPFTDELRRTTQEAITDSRALFEQSQIESPKSQIPKAVFKPPCEECSLFNICLPKATCAGSRAARLAGQLFEI